MTSTTGPQALTNHQLGILFRPVHPNRVGHTRGMSHMEAWDIRRELIRVFGFGGWSLETLSLDLVAERGVDKQSKKDGSPYTAWTVVYRAQVRLTIKDTAGREIARYEDGAAGDSVNQPSLGDAHDMAMKTALSQAMKRCAVNLGDQFGLSLYNNGSTEAVVGWSAAHPPAEQGKAPVAEVPDDAPVQPEPQPAPAEQEPVLEAAPPAAPTPPVAAAPVPAPPAPEDPERAAALTEMWDAARHVGFVDGLPGQFAQSFGHPIERGTTAEFRQARELMLATTAA